MLYKLVALACFVCPLIGLIAIESGAQISLEAWGYPNGASIAFACYALLVAGTVAVSTRVQWIRGLGSASHSVAPPRADMRAIMLRSVVALAPMTLFVLYSIGGLETLMGKVGAGEFRSNLGNGGALGYLILKYYAPSILSFVLLNWMHSPDRGWSWGLILITALCAVIASSFGFKSGVMTMLLPAAILIFWRTSYKIAAAVAVACGLLIFLGYATYEGVRSVPAAVLAFLNRLFVLQGDIAWSIWGQYLAGTEFPSYWNTLLPLLGGRAFTMLTGISTLQVEAWVDSHFNLMATKIAGYPAEMIMQYGHNGSATVFSEGLVAGGIAGLAAFAVLAGLVLSALYWFIDNRLKAGAYADASIAGSYFVMGVMAWLIGGGVETIMHISILVAAISSRLLLLWIELGTYQLFDQTRRRFATLLPRN
jgi:hypothetical protein